MDFKPSYTEEQQIFRATVRRWLELTASPVVENPDEGGPLTPEIQRKIKEFRRHLGAKGWLAPTWSKEYGGGDLSLSLAVVVQEEIQRLKLPSLGDNYRWIPAMMDWGTEDQKRRYVPPCFGGSHNHLASL